MSIGRLAVHRYRTRCARRWPHVTWSKVVVSFCTGRALIAWRRV